MDSKKIVRYLLILLALFAFAFFANEFVGFHSIDPIEIPMVGKEVDYQLFAYGVLTLLIVLTIVLYSFKFTLELKLAKLYESKKVRAGKIYPIQIGVLAVLILLLLASGLVLKLNYSSDKVYDVEAKV